MIIVCIALFLFVVIAKMCVEPIKPFRGYVNYTGLSYGSVATYSCRCGYRLIGSKVRNCQGNGVWSGNSTICIGKWKSGGEGRDICCDILSVLP